MRTATGTSYKKTIRDHMWCVKAQVFTFEFEVSSLKHRKALISIVIYVRLSVRTYQCGSH